MRIEEVRPAPFFSVIVPVYNKEKNVGRALKSILNQSFEDFEIIVVCDPSTDSSYEEVCVFSDKRIRVYSRKEPGPGGYAARNLGIEKAKGAWIAFLDADDEWLSDRLLSHKKIIDQHDCGLICSSWKDVYDDGSKSTPLPLQEGLLTAKEFFKLYGSAPRVIHTNTISCKKINFNAMGGFPAGSYNRGGDVYTWLKLVDHSGFLYRTTEEVSVYHKGDSTVTKTHRPDIEGNAVYDMCETLTNTGRVSLIYKFYLWRISNRHIRYGLVDRVKAGDFNLRHLRYYRFYVNPVDYTKFFVAGLTSSRLRKRIVNIIMSKS